MDWTIDHVADSMLLRASSTTLREYTLYGRIEYSHLAMGIFGTIARVDMLFLIRLYELEILVY